MPSQPRRSLSSTRTNPLAQHPPSPVAPLSLEKSPTGAETTNTPDIPDITDTAPTTTADEPHTPLLSTAYRPTTSRPPTPFFPTFSSASKSKAARPSPTKRKRKSRPWPLPSSSLNERIPTTTTTSDHTAVDSSTDKTLINPTPSLSSHEDLGKAGCGERCIHRKHLHLSLFALALALLGLIAAIGAVVGAAGRARGLEEGMGRMGRECGLGLGGGVEEGRGVDGGVGGGEVQRTTTRVEDLVTMVTVTGGGEAVVTGAPGLEVESEYGGYGSGEVIFYPTVTMTVTRCEEWCGEGDGVVVARR